MGPLKKTSLFQLVSSCRDVEHQRFLQWICSREESGKVLWHHFVESQCLGFAELLLLIPSCYLSLETLLACTNAAVPRFYSIATSPLVAPTSIAIAFSVVHYHCDVTVGHYSASLRRYGLASSYLEWIAQPWLKNMPCSAPIETPSCPQLRIFLKPTITFRLPGSMSTPLILIGPGTGVAPFLGFLDHRLALECNRTRTASEICTGVWRGGFELDDLPSEQGSVAEFSQCSPGPVMLFFGCRGPAEYLYQSELEHHLYSGSLTGLEVAFSRYPSEGHPKEYVTHRLLARGSELYQWIVHENGYLYICGDGNHMAKDVFQTIKSILMTHGHLNDDQAEDYLKDMKQRRRYLLDIWS